LKGITINNSKFEHEIMSQHVIAKNFSYDADARSGTRHCEKLRGFLPKFRGNLCCTAIGEVAMMETRLLRASQ
jgi:hypothetical protein